MIDKPNRLRVLGDYTVVSLQRDSNMRAAREASLVNASLCTHRFKDEEAKMARCQDCGVMLHREAERRRTGKTQRVRAGARA